MSEVYYCLVYDRDGGLICDPEAFDTYEEADEWGSNQIDDPRYGSHEVEKDG